jgi:chemotaxis protein CheD
VRSWPETKTRAAYYLHPGHVWARRQPTSVVTILGSCVAVTLWDRRLGCGGISHYLLPQWAGPGTDDPLRYGNTALAELVAAVRALGAEPCSWQAGLYGGASILAAFRARGDTLGARNVDLARQFLKRSGIPVVAEDVGGQRGRRLVFLSDDGSSEVTLL